jgi:glycosyltransferase involved in cell wall biosynthesis
MGVLVINNNISVFGGDDRAAIEMTRRLNEELSVEAILFGARGNNNLPYVRSLKSALFSVGILRLFNLFIFFELLIYGFKYKPEKVIFHTLSGRISWLALLSFPGVDKFLVHHDFFGICSQRNRFRNDEICKRCSMQRDLILSYNCTNQKFKSIFLFFDKKIYKIARGLTKINDVFVSKHFLDEFKAKGVNGVLHRNYLNNDQDSQRIIRWEKHLVGFFGRDSVEKGMSSLELFLQINLQYRLITTIQRPGWKNVESLPFMNKSEMLKVLSRLQYLVVPSKWEENMPMLILEAYSVGTPVIVSNVGGLPEMVEHGVTGWIVDNWESWVLPEVSDNEYDSMRSAAIDMFYKLNGSLEWIK